MLLYKKKSNTMLVFLLHLFGVPNGAILHWTEKSSSLRHFNGSCPVSSGLRVPVAFVFRFKG